MRKNPLALLTAGFWSLALIVVWKRVRTSTFDASNERPAGAAWESIYPSEFTCEPMDPTIIIYNRPLKTGSTSMVSLMQRLAKIHKYSVVQVQTRFNHSLAMNAIGNALKSGEKTIIQNHFDFPEVLYEKKIAYINMIRDPVDRCISFYYWRRYSPLRKDHENADFLKEHGKNFQCCVLFYVLLLQHRSEKACLCLCQSLLHAGMIANHLWMFSKLID